MREKSIPALGITGIGIVLIVVFVYFFGGKGTAPDDSLHEENTTGTADTSSVKKTENTVVVGGKEIAFDLPKQFSVSLFAEGLSAPRVLVQDASGNILVSIPELGKVVALPDEDHDGKADQVVTVLTGLNRPHGLAVRCGENLCELFVAESDKLTRYAYDGATMGVSGKKKLADLPRGDHDAHSLLIAPVAPEEKLLITSGSSCNVCEESDWRRAKVLSVNFDGSDFKVFASGLRNAPFLATDPVTGKVWATEMGRDNLGDALPPDEINILVEGENYGWPLCYGKGIHDSDFDKKQYVRDPCADFAPSFIDIPAHSAPLGLAFIPEEGWLDGFGNNLLVAYHGSWNSDKPSGYKIVRHVFDAHGDYRGAEDFMTGFFPKSSRASGWGAPGAALGRPAGILTLPGGVAYISDDKEGVIYRVMFMRE